MPSTPLAASSEDFIADIARIIEYAAACDVYRDDVEYAD